MVMMRTSHWTGEAGSDEGRDEGREAGRGGRTVDAVVHRSRPFLGVRVGALPLTDPWTIAPWVILSSSHSPSHFSHRSQPKAHSSHHSSGGKNRLNFSLLPSNRIASHRIASHLHSSTYGHPHLYPYTYTNTYTYIHNHLTSPHPSTTAR